MGSAKRLFVSDIEMQKIRLAIEGVFPNLITHKYEAESESTEEYNCIAWAAGDTERWWWPHVDAFWPASVQRSVDIRYFIAAFETLNYEVCGEEFSFESKYEKVAIYTDLAGKPTHMARQLESGIWASKLGEWWDIVHHTLEGVEGGSYGRATLAMRRIRV
jgi:hypothetical protein